MRKNLSILLSFIIVCAFFVQPASAQSSGPVYIVQAGDTLSYIASRFNVSLDELVAANPMLDPNALAEGQEIVIPGLEGVTGILDTEIISFGDSLRSLSRRTQVSDEQLIRLNRLVSPTELYVGTSLIIPTQEKQSVLNTRFSATSGESLLELAVKENSDPWTLTTLNKLDGTWETIPGDVLYSPSGNTEGNATGLPSAFRVCQHRAFTDGPGRDRGDSGQDTKRGFIIRITGRHASSLCRGQWRPGCFAGRARDAGAGCISIAIGSHAP